MESAKTNEAELTSTMGNLLSTSKDEKNDASDSTPTSSTDAFTTTSTSQIATDDPISSTSSDVLDAKKSTDKVNDVAQSSINVISCNPIISLSMGDHSSSFVSEKDLLVMNITDTSTEKITENVDDIVQDLENLLGEPTTSFDFTIRRKRNVTSVTQSEHIAADIDEYSAELRRLEENSTMPNEIKKDISIAVRESVNMRNSVVDPVNKNNSEELNVESISTNTAEIPVKNDAAEPCVKPVQQELQSSQSDNQNSESFLNNINDIKVDTIEKIQNEDIENCQFEIISPSGESTDPIPLETNEASEDITSTHSKAELDESSDLKSENSTECVPAVDINIEGSSRSDDATVLIVDNKEEDRAISTSEVEENQASSEEKTESPTSNEIIADVPVDEDVKGVDENQRKESGSDFPVQENMNDVDEQQPEETSSVPVQDVDEQQTNETSSDVVDVPVQENMEDVDEKQPQETSSDVIDVPVQENLNDVDEKQPEETSFDAVDVPVQDVDEQQANETSSDAVDVSVQDVDEQQANETSSDVVDVPVEEKQPQETGSDVVDISVEENMEDVDESEPKETSSGAVDLPVQENMEDVDESQPKETSSGAVDLPVQENMEDVDESQPKETSSGAVDVPVQENMEDVDEDQPKETSSDVVETQDQEKMEEVEGEFHSAKIATEDEMGGEKPECFRSTIEKEIIDTVVPDATKPEELEIQSTIESTNNAELERMAFAASVEESAQSVNSEVFINNTEEPVTVEKPDLPVPVEEIEGGTTEEVKSQIICTSTNQEGEAKDGVKETELLNSDEAQDGKEEKMEVVIPSVEAAEEKMEIMAAELTGNEEKCVLSDGGDAQRLLEDSEQHFPVQEDTLPNQSQDPEIIEPAETIDQIDTKLGTSEGAEPIKREVEQSKTSEEIVEMGTVEPLEDASTVDFVSDGMELPSRSLAEDLDLLVQNAVNDESPSPVPVEDLTDFEVPNENNIEIPSVDNLKNLEEIAIENTMLPLQMEDVPDLDVLNAINTLNDDKSDQNNQESDALLTSSTIDEASETDVPFETALPTVDEIFAEQNQQEQMELQDDNLETLLAVASLQNVDYNMPVVEDFVPEDPIFEPTKIQDELKENDFLDEVAQPTEIEKSEENVTQHKLIEPLVINVDDTEKERVYSPKITIKPIKPPEEEVEVVSSASEAETNKGSLKMTITKQSDNTHSILKIYSPDDDSHNQDDQSAVPKLIIKPIVQPNEQPQSPKMSTRSCKQVFSPTSSANQRSASPRITIKPIVKPEESVAPLKITIKPVLKPEESHKQKHSPKLTIKPIIKPEEESVEPKVHSPRVTIKPIVKPPEEVDQISSPRITIKPIVKPSESVPEALPSTPRSTKKPLVKHPEKEKSVDILEQLEKTSPKITIKPIVKPHEVELPPEDYEESIKERIVLKINKGTIPGSSKELRKRDLPLEEEKSEKLAKIKLKFSKEGGHPHIVQDQSPTKRLLEQVDHDKNKRQRIDTEHFLPGVTITPIGPGTHSKLKEMLSRNDYSSDKVVTIDDDDDDVTIVEETNKPSPIVISEESNQDSMTAALDLRDPISEIPVFEITPDSVKTINPQPVAPVVEVPAPAPAPRKRGRPRKVPLQVREDFKDPKEEEPKPVVVESTRPKRSCRGQSVRTTLGIKPRKPRGPGRGRGSKRGMGTRSTPTPPESPPKVAKEPKLSGAKLKELKEDSFLLSDKTEVKTIEIDDGLQKSPSNSLLAPPQSDTTDRADIVMYEEETRMSAETSSRAQTPAKQVITTVDLVEESQSSVQSIQSTATTESVKVRKGPRLEVHQEPEGAVISADQLAEYFWSGGGPYMLQEQVAQFLGIKSFKRKYPNIARRVVDMQERDFIRESGLAGEAMCDLGLTAVNSSDILDIMYSDFQDKYEEYCKHQRDRQAKDLINKQRALSLAASQEKAKMDITQQAVQSAASWNATFNKARRDQRKACMDLQTLTVHFPKGKMKQINKPKIGYYPVALVPGQFTDYYREFTPTEINNLPLNTLCYNPIVRENHHEMECDSQTDGSGSESDTSSSDSDSSYSGSSDAEDCTLCKPTPKRVAAAQ